MVFSGNVVAGCPDIGVLMRPETCEAVEQDTVLGTRHDETRVQKRGVSYIMLYIYILIFHDTTKNPHGYNLIQYDTIMDV